MKFFSLVAGMMIGATIASAIGMGLFNPEQVATAAADAAREAAKEIQHNICPAPIRAEKK